MTEHVNSIYTLLIADKSTPKKLGFWFGFGFGFLIFWVFGFGFWFG